MERRKFLIGAGSLAAGSAAAMGTGAFTSVQANRDIEVSVADDADALLAMSPSGGENGDYAVVNDDGTIGIDISDDNPSNPSEFEGDGVNENAYTNILNVFTITNQGTQDVTVWASGIGANLGGASYDPDRYVDLVATDLPGQSGSVSLTGGGYSGTIPDDLNDDWVLEPGESFDVGIYIDTTSDGSDELDYDEVTIHADAEAGSL